MRLRNRLKGLRSVFSRAVRRVKAFFGREEDGEQATSAAAFAVVAAQWEEANDKRDEGSGSGSGATAPVWRGPDGGDAPECASRPEREDPGACKNYADEASIRREREQEPDEDLVPDEDEERRNRLNRQKVRKLQEQLARTQHQQRIIANARAAKARQALSEAELEARLEELQEDQDQDGRPNDPEKDGAEPEFY